VPQARNPIQEENKIMKMRSIIAALTLSVALPATAVLAKEVRQMEYDAALACVQATVPGSSYVTNDLVPDPANLIPDAPLAETVSLRVGMPWVLNDEQAPFYNAIELGYYAQEGLEIELVPGGPGKNHVQTLAGGVVDIAVHASGVYLPRALTSPTPITGIKVVGSILKGAPSVLLTIDPELQDRKLTPADLAGKVIGGAPFLEHMKILLDKAGMAQDSVEIVRAGFTPDILYANGADFYLGWVFNQTRDIEAKGHKWNGLMWRDYAFDNYTDVIVMKDEMLTDPARREVAERFMRATYRGLQFLLNNPEQSAEIAVEYSVDATGLTKEDAMFRFERQEFLIRGDQGEDLMKTNPAEWDKTTATLLQYGFMPTISCN
jgi:ABC-type nitrate/sulfonate/bicarbonate transport system substrate-binding protein